VRTRLLLPDAAGTTDARVGHRRWRGGARTTHALGRQAVPPEKAPENRRTRDDQSGAGVLMHPRGHFENPRRLNRPVFAGHRGEDRGEFARHCPREPARNPLRLAKSLKRKDRDLAERVGFEPTCRLRDKTLSRRPRYDHFGTSPCPFPQHGLLARLAAHGGNIDYTRRIEAP
jgi:hypothetical protein